jgi:copper chaperone CopZ
MMKPRNLETSREITLDNENGGAAQLEKTFDSPAADCCNSPMERHKRVASVATEADEIGSYTTASFAVEGMSCQACASKIEAALSGIPGVLRGTVNLAGSRATVSFDPDGVSLDGLRVAVEAVGYRLLLEGEAKSGTEKCNQLTRLKGPFAHSRPYLIGLTAALGVVGFYLGLITLTADWHFARSQFSEYRWWILGLAAGLGVQAILYTALRGQLMGRHKKAAKSSLAASGGVSTISMAACCAHYLVAFLPALGLPFLSTALASLDQYQSYFFLVGVVSNLFGIGLMLRLLAKNGMLPRLGLLGNLAYFPRR